MSAGEPPVTSPPSDHAEEGAAVKGTPASAWAHNANGALADGDSLANALDAFQVRAVVTAMQQGSV